jgi:ArsR family transcriptional regulator, zinc-responsive transcriptional repressor
MLSTNLNAESLSLAAECLRTLAHPMRLKLLLLLEEKRLTVGELAHACEMKNNVTSEHLRLMMRCGFLSVEKEGQRTYYQISESHVFSILSCVKSRFA